MLKEKFKTEYLSFGLTGCFVDSSEKYALIHIFKNASISLRNALNMRGNYREWKEIKNIKNIETLCVVREPIKRFISAYQYILRLEDGGGFPHRHPIEVTRCANFFLYKDDVVESFLMFLDFVEKRGFYDAVLVSQKQFLKSRNLSIEDINHVFILEKIDDQYKNFCKLKGIKNKLKIDNSSPTEKTNELLNFVNFKPKVKNRILNLYEEDFILYNELWRKSEFWQNNRI